MNSKSVLFTKHDPHHNGCCHEHRHTFKFADTEYNTRLSSDIVQFRGLWVSREELSPMEDATAKPNAQCMDLMKRGLDKFPKSHRNKFTSLVRRGFSCGIFSSNPQSLRRKSPSAYVECFFSSF